MVQSNFHLIGRGLYTLSEAERFSGVSRRRILRWTRGYTFAYRGTDRYSPPVIATDVEPVDGQPVLDFLDLIEVRFLDAFRRHGVSWAAIRIAAQRASELIGRPRPFSTRIFRTDGHTILAELVAEAGDAVLLDLVKNQYEFEKVLSPFLYGGLDFNEHQEPARWWPLGHDRSVVIDPLRGFGAPIISLGGIPTRVLHNTFRAEESLQAVADWFEVSVESVHDAVDYEVSLKS